MLIRPSTDSDLSDVLRVNREAFGSDEESTLVDELLNDPTAQPSISLLAWDGAQAVGHILFTSIRFEPVLDLNASILAPMAVVPERQNRAIGGMLIDRGLALLTAANTDLVFVLGHPTYYPRFGFVPAGERGFEAPYPIEEKNAGAWMVLPLANELPDASARVVCADVMMKPEYWRE